MALHKADVEKIAHLARLSIDERDTPEYTRQLSNILALVGQMNAVDTSGIEPMAHPLDMPQRLRPDEVTETDRREELQAIAPLLEAGLYLVPKVIE